MDLKLTSIGVIHAPHHQVKGTPIQPRWAAGIEGTVEVFQMFAAGLRDLDGFERIWLLCWFDQARQAQLEVVPYRDTQTRGVFATRAPSRPNPIGLSCVRLLGVQGATLRVADLDILDGTPLLDIKPYLSDFDAFIVHHTGWYANALNQTTADERFKDDAQIFY